ncbi:MAG: hypothetical protein OJF51_004695 [Nitrospira sp.]|nr:MAG: hypothetical protein OJF51_004695 [Nitrospira sp.]
MEVGDTPIPMDHVSHRLAAMVQGPEALALMVTTPIDVT